MSRRFCTVLGISFAILVYWASIDSPWRLAAWPRSEKAAMRSWLEEKSDRYYTLFRAYGSSQSEDLVVSGVSDYVRATLGWPPGMEFAKFDATLTVESVLFSPPCNMGAFLLVVPGNETLRRRTAAEPLITIADNIPESSGLIGASINAALATLEFGLGRPMFSFHLRAHDFPLCRTGWGLCALWEGSTGKVWFDSHLLEKMRTVGGLSEVLGLFSSKLVETVPLADDEGKMTGGDVPSRLATAASVAMAAASMIAGPPLWFCIACPLLLGMAAPWIFNLGLTAAAAALCKHLSLSEDECLDLWWGAFALALILSLASAVPIVYICRLPSCGKRNPNSTVVP